MKRFVCAIASLLERGRFPALALILSASISAPAFAQGDSAGGAPGVGAPAPISGEQIYRTTCAACHMLDGKGATGAATVPALAGNPKLAVAAYPITIALIGKGVMPGFSDYLTPAQLAAVLTYVRTSLGNSYKPVTEADVTQIAAAKPHR